MPKDDSDDISAFLKKKPKTKEVIPTKSLLSTGSTVFNLAATGRRKGGFPKGKYVLFVGDSESGKTWFTMTCLAEAVKDPAFKAYRFIHDDAEDGASMDKVGYFGKAVADRIEPPHGTKDEPVYSETVEDFYEYLDDAIQDGRPFIYIMDSENALDSRSNLARLESNKDEHRKGNAEDDSYGVEKAKAHSTRLRIARNRLRNSGSILIILSQTRDKLNAKPFQEQKTRAGGKALRFFADLEIWSAVAGQLKRSVAGKDRVVGNIIQLKFKKNRITGDHHTVEVPFRAKYGIDDLLGCIDYLIEEGHWTGTEKLVAAPEFDYPKGSKDDLIVKLEKEDKEDELRALVEDVWSEIADKSKPVRKPRYT